MQRTRSESKTDYVRTGYVADDANKLVRLFRSQQISMATTIKQTVSSSTSMCLVIASISAYRVGAPAETMLYTLAGLTRGTTRQEMRSQIAKMFSSASWCGDNYCSL